MSFVKDRIVQILLVLTLMLGYILGRNIDVVQNVGDILNIPGIRYYFIIASFYLDYLLFLKINNTSILYRNKNRLLFFKKLISSEVLLNTLIVIVFYIPIYFLNIDILVGKGYVLIFQILNIVIVNLVFTSIVKIVDIKISKINVSMGLVISLILFMDIFYEFFISVILERDVLFYFSNIYSLYFKLNLISFLLALLLLIIIIISITIYFIIKMIERDYLLKKNEDIY